MVAQRLAPSARIDIDYFDGDGHVRRMRDGVTRLRSFLLRGRDGDCRALGSHLTVSSEERVSESIAAVQAPIVFTTEEQP